MSTLEELEKTASFTKWMTPDPEIPSVDAAKSAEDSLVRSARPVKGSFCWVAPEKITKYELIGVSPALMEELGIAGDEKNQKFLDILAGQSLSDSVYPWAKAYSGWQFGEWGGQLGDGRVVSLFEVQNKDRTNRYEVQLKGAGKTPFSRYADGRSVIETTIREALASEALHGLGIPTTRALAAIRLPGMTVKRKRVSEECAITVRLAESWVRFGTFDFHRSRGNRDEMRKLADYCIEEVYRNKLQVKEGETRYDSFFREVALRSARLVALWQSHGFVNGALNTDNSSILGLSLDYGPFGFMDTFDPNYTSNHEDGLSRYAYKNVPSVMWWNLIRLGENIGELLGAGPKLVDDEVFVKEGVKKDQVSKILERAEKFIESVGDEYEQEFKSVYNQTMAKRLGITYKEEDFDSLLSPLLEMLQECELDYNQFLRKLCSFPLFSENTLDDVDIFIPKVRNLAPNKSTDEVKKNIKSWLEVYKSRLEKECLSDDDKRKERTLLANPNFILKTWVINDVVEKVTSGDNSAFDNAMKMALDPYAESWGVPDEEKYCGEVPRSERDMLSSCGS
ncbi:protein adenylyltransferase SelO, mitochondrial [Trichomonascus vanleenenianus]|uniref:Fmp40p n=1 Tax=Trichomonascus vanleenenianus TaxID=2268995 RepID=UPI003ECAB9C6